MIIITGAAGFIGSCLLQKMNEEGISDVLLVDEFSRTEKNINFQNKSYTDKMDRRHFLDWLTTTDTTIDAIFHIGARTDTTEKDVEIFDRLNLSYTKAIWRWCADNNIPLIYASSAATYGLGEHGYNDNHQVVDKLKPLNPYGDSKQDFDKWALAQDKQPPHWYGLKFFNVYGPNEFHKQRMASVILHTVRQIKKTGAMKLFRSHREDYKDGEQSRDFIYVKDVVDIIMFLYNQRPTNGLYNVGTGNARSFYDLAANTFRALDLEPQISFIDTPLDIRNTYQYFTEANMQKLREAGYTKAFYTLEEGIKDYVQQYLKETEKHW